MIFGPVSLDQALGKILAHNIAGPEGRLALRKGRRLTHEDLRLLVALGRQGVYVADLEPGDVPEDQAAVELATHIAGRGLKASRPHAGRVNLTAQYPGVLWIDSERLASINRIEGLTVATLASRSVVDERRVVATVKVVPFALPQTSLQRAKALAAEPEPLAHSTRLVPRRVVLVLSGSPFARERVWENFAATIQARVEALRSRIDAVVYVPLEDLGGEIELAETLASHKDQGAEVILLAGETAIMDPNDIAPRAVRRAGGEVVTVGAPVDPGNLLMLAYLGEVPVVGLPGCARSRKVNVIDWVLPAVLAGERLSQAEIAGLGHGGLLEDDPHRPMPRLRQNRPRRRDSSEDAPPD